MKENTEKELSQMKYKMLFKDNPLVDFSWDIKISFSLFAIIISLFSILLTLFFCTIALARDEKAINDGSGRPEAITGLACDEATCTETRNFRQSTAGGILTTLTGTSTITIATPTIKFQNEFTNDFEYGNISVAPLSSGSCSPSASMSSFIVISFSTGDYYINYDPDGPAFATDALHLPGFSNRSISIMDTAQCAIYNPTPVSELFSYEWGRNIP